MEGMGNPHGGTMFGPDEQENPNDTPTVSEYKKLKRVMRIMNKFYEDGSAAKLDQAEDMEHELHKVQVDLCMVEAQIKALEPFPGHPKKTSYLEELSEERDRLVKMRDNFQKKATNFRALYQWSLGIVDCIRWLTLGLDDYCVNFLKMELDITPSPLPKPTLDQYHKYKEGLDEVHLNLHESQDFFQASLDGRLRRYHQIEKEIIEAQIKALQAFPPMNERKVHWDDELTKDLEFVGDNSKETPASTSKREKMLSMHKDFVNTLTWFKSRLSGFAKELGIDENAEKGADSQHPTNKQVEFMLAM
eukprot:TRINITY_DN262_c0_g1_i1.p2 TRINITY_DN262_c0_g1~~TRINITY_DN262_c0_g1_i1.p2  ORF type:complete len:304 (-),score=84.59 TRINITY_DN262_c0_g1_i1:1093-2004(-)